MMQRRHGLCLQTPCKALHHPKQPWHVLVHAYANTWHVGAWWWGGGPPNLKYSPIRHHGAQTGNKGFNFGAMAGTWQHSGTCGAAHVPLHAFFAARNWQMGGMHFKKTTEWLLLQLDSTLQAHTTRVDLYLGHGRAHIAQAVTWPP